MALQLLLVPVSTLMFYFQKVPNVFGAIFTNLNVIGIHYDSTLGTIIFVFLLTDYMSLFKFRTKCFIFNCEPHTKN